MPRIPEDLVDRLKHEISLVALAERSAVELKKMGHELMGRCPFPPHEDSTASLSINALRNVFQCFGCGAAGTPIDWVMREKGVDFREAVEVLLRDFYPSEADQILGTSSRQRVRRSSPAVLPSPFEPEGSDQDLLNRYTDLCHAILKESAVVQEYLRKRGLDSSEVVSHFGLGYADRSLGLRLPEKVTKAGAAIRARLQKLGILRESGHEAMVGSLIIAIRDEAGNVRNLYGRKTRDDLRPGTPDHLYLPGPRHGVFNVEALKASGEVILCESLIDALTFWRWGFRHVTTAYGVNGFTDDLLAAMKAHRTEKVLIAFDRDEAGESGARKVGEKLMAAGIECLRVVFPKGMDVNEVALKMQPADKTLDLFLRSAEWMGKGATPHAASEATRSDSTAAAPGPTEATEKERDGATEKEKASEPAPEAAHPSPVASFAQPEPASGTPTRSVEPVSEPPEARANGLVKLTDNEALFAFEDRRYRIRELKKGLSHGSLRLTIRAEREGDYFAPPSPISGWFLDTVDLCLSRQRGLFEKNAAHEMGVKDEVIRFDLGKIVRALEELQDQRIAQALEPKVKTPAMTETQHEEALALAKDPHLLDRIALSFEKIGIVGEATNALVLYLAATSRKLDRPLAIVIRSSSAAGKTVLMDAVLALIPDEEQERYSALTENVLFYFEGKDFKHKILAIAEEEGAQRASYPLKLLQSEGVVTLASTGKDPATGRLDAKEYRVEGPLMLLLTSAASDIDEEFLNRCLILTVDESREQTRRIHELQREAETLEGFLGRSERVKLKTLHQNLQRLLRPLAVFNPFSRELTFLDEKTRTRRDHPKYLTLIRSITLLHQHQREVKTCLDAEGKTVEYIEVTRADIALANRLAAEVLGHSLSELPPQTRKLLALLYEWVAGECETAGVAREDFLFSRRQVREVIAWGDTQLKIHLARLVELEYLLVHRGGRGQSFLFELVYEGQGTKGERFALGLIDSETLTYDRNRSGFSDDRSGQAEERSALGRPLVGGVSGGGRPHEITLEAAPGAAPDDSEADEAENAQLPFAPEIPRPKTVSGRNGHRVTSVSLNLLRFPPTPGGNGNGNGQLPRRGRPGAPELPVMAP